MIGIDLRGRVALVTGGSRGIGRACVIRLAEAGADVVINYVTSRAAAEEVAGQARTFGGNVAIIKADVSERDDVESMVDFVRRELGSIDIIVSNAATGGFRPLIAASDKNFDGAMHTNVRPLIYLVQAALPVLENRPHRTKVVVMSSHGSHMALPMYGTIGASKAAVEALARHFALELGDRGINFNVVKAGLVETDSTRRIPGADKIFAASTEKTMVGQRHLLPEDVANAVLYLASPLSDLVQGEVLTVDGGAAIHI